MEDNFHLRPGHSYCKWGFRYEKLVWAKWFSGKSLDLITENLIICGLSHYILGNSLQLPEPLFPHQSNEHSNTDISACEDKVRHRWKCLAHLMIC